MAFSFWHAENRSVLTIMATRYMYKVWVVADADEFYDGWLARQPLLTLINPHHNPAVKCVSMSKGELPPFHHYNCIISGDGWNLSLLLIHIQLRHQTSDALLELAVLGGVDERVDAAAGKRQCHGEVVEPKNHNTKWRYNKSTECIHLTEVIASHNVYWK